jgi:hypothetical protein
MAKSATQRALSGPEPTGNIDPETGEILGPTDMVATDGTGVGTSIQISERDHDLLEKYAGEGFSHEAEDRLTPVLAVLQDLSGEVKKNHERRVEGAEAGMFILRSMRLLYPGEPGLLVQPFGFSHFLIEWTGDAGDGVPVNRFPWNDPPTDLYETPHPQDPSRTIMKRRSTGNRLVDTREHYANLIVQGLDPFPIVIPMSGSNHNTSRQWTNMMSNMSYQGRKLPAFFRSYSLKTVFRKKGSNMSWYAYHVDPRALITNRALLELGAASVDAMKMKPIEANLGDMHEVDDSQPVAPQAQSPVNPADHI